MNPLKKDSVHFVDMTEVDLWKLSYIIKTYGQKWSLAERNEHLGQWFFPY